MYPKIILASTSPRRQNLLKLLKIDFTTQTPNIDETPLKNEQAYDLVHRLAILKGQLVAKDKSKDTITISGDLVIEFEGKIIGKPRDFDDAFFTLLSLSAKSHYIRSGWAVFKDSNLISSGVSSAIVQFKKLDELTIKNYLDNIVWKDKAGSYAIQDSMANHKMIIENITGSLYSIIGLPLKEIATTLISLGAKIDKQNILDIIEMENDIFWLYDKITLK